MKSRPLAKAVIGASAQRSFTTQHFVPHPMDQVLGKAPGGLAQAALRHKQRFA
jgi:hypothetical protein